jgi:D-alanyl-lipoteichoic acid acyltransferase DltB (MBOAT superfamily)
MPQFADPATYRPSLHNFAVGATIFFIGLFKKVVLADPASGTVAAGFAHSADLQLYAAWTTALSYSLQLYFDFSGYSDMAIGLARMFNVKFPLNFDSPYKSASIIDYWQRWHMTLTRYLTLFLFNPVAMAMTRRLVASGMSPREAQTSRKGFLRVVIFPTFLTMGLIGIWHGAGTQYLVFGLLHGAFLSLNNAWRIFGPKKAKGAKAAPDRWHVHVAKVALTYFAVLFAVMFFRASSTEAALQMLAGLWGLHGVEARFALSMRDVAWFVALYLIVFGLPNTQQIMSRVEPALGRIRPNPIGWLVWQPSWPWAVACGVGATLALLSMGGATEFLYFQF